MKSLFFITIVILFISACSVNKNLVIEAVSCDTGIHTSIVEETIPVQTKATDILQPIMFDYDSSEIRQDQKVVIDKVVKLLNEYPDINIIVSGFASLEGSIEYNKNLSQDRVNSVIEALIDKGISNKRIKESIANGETDYFGQTLEPNRRVIIISINPI